MSSRIEQLIDEIEEYIDTCKYSAFSNSKIIVDKDQIDDLLRELKSKTPDEIKRYQKIISNRDAILTEAKNKAEALINEATVHTNELINEHEIMQQAYAQANEVVQLASAQAQEILDKATMEANDVKMSALQYTDDSLAAIENILSRSIETVENHYSGLLRELNEYLDVIRANRNELHPADEDIPVGEVGGGVQSNANLNVI